MKTGVLCAALVAVLALIAFAGCKGKSAETEAPAPAARESAPAATTAYPQGSIKVGDKAICAVCAASGGEHGTEEVKAVLDYQGKTYAFCNEAEKAEFISNPGKYAQAQQAP